ncbi:MAG TPA: hypothetical protein DDZ51_12000 [Planctomycetaceae bacterium]|nr:hypothetical protein [Planctomycetaceae bacterium]
MIDREECSYLHTDGTLASRDDLLKIIDWYKSRDSGDALTPEFRLELARSYYFCSVAGRRRKEPKPSTMEQLEIAISIYERLIADCENRPVDPEHWQRLVRCSAAALIVRCDMRIPDYAGCLSDLDIGISRLTSLSKSLRDENCYLHLQVCWELGELHNQRANIHLLLNEKDAALLRDYNHSVDSFVRATEVAAALEEKRFLAEAFERLSQQLHVRADKLARIGSFCAAITDLRRAIEILPQNSKDVEIHLSLAAAHEAYGWEFQCNGNLQRAYDEYSLAAGQATHVLKERPKISILRLNRNLGRSYSLSCDGGLQVGQKPSKLVEECLVRIAFVFKQVGRAIFTRELLQECNWWINFCKLNLLVVPSRQVEEWGPILDCILEKTGIAILFIDSPSVLKVSVISRSQVKFLRSQKTGRNSPCLCGSGLKYKKCCMRKST